MANVFHRRIGDVYEISQVEWSQMHV